MSIVWTPKLHFCGGRAYLRMYLTGIFTILCALALSACGESTPRGYAGSPATATTDTLKPIALPPGSGERPTLPGTTGNEKTADGLPVLSSMGMNTALFTGKINDDDRFVRLENAVQELRNDFNAMAPAIVRLVSIEKDIQNLISQLDGLTGNSDSMPIEPIESSELDYQDTLIPETAAPSPAQELAQTITAAPAPDENAAQVATSSPEPIAPPPPLQELAQAPPSAAPMPSGTTVKDMRVGEHPGKVRIVLDLKGKTAFKADLDNVEHILVVELPDTAWGTANTKQFSGNPLLSSYRTSPLDNGAGTMLILQLKKASAITYQTAIPDPDGVSSRVVIDLSTAP